MVVLGQTLWNDTASFEDISRDFYDASFGADGSKVQEYLATLSALFYPPYLRVNDRSLTPNPPLVFQG